MDSALLVVTLSFVVLVMLGLPIAYAMILAAAFYLTVLNPIVPITLIPQTGIGMISESFTLLAVPLFLLAGDLMNESGMTRRLVGFALAVVGHIRGGMGHAVVMANVIMAGMSGSATADAAGIGSMMIPALRRAGFPAPSAAALCAASASIGPIIPPSIVMVLYASFTGVSVGRMFLAGFIPGILMALFLMLDLYMSPTTRAMPRGRFQWAGVAATARDAVLAILMPLVLLGGMFGGLYTPTEAAAVAVAYVLLIGTVVYRSLTLRVIFASFRRVGATTGAVMLIVAAANAISWIVTVERAGAALTAVFAPLISEPFLTLLALTTIVLIVGCFLDTSAIVIVLPPIMAPIVAAAGIDPVHFGLVFCLATTLGLITPPVGVSMFITCALAGIGTAEFARAIVRPLIALILSMLVMMAFPQTVLFLPNLIMGS